MQRANVVWYSWGKYKILILDVLVNFTQVEVDTCVTNFLAAVSGRIEPEITYKFPYVNIFRDFP